MKPITLPPFLAALYFAALVAGAEARTALVVRLEIDSTQVKEHREIRHFYNSALLARYPGKLLPAQPGAADCSDKDCALKMAKAQRTDDVIYGNVRSLGLKLFFTSTLMGADGKSAYSQLITIANPDEIESAARNMAEALIKHEPAKPLSRTAKAAPEPEREDVPDTTGHSLRKTPPIEAVARHFYSTGVSVGYALPFGNSYRRWKYRAGCNSASVACSDLDLFQQKYTGVKIGWNNWVELSDRLALETDILWYDPIVIGADLNLEYFFNDADFSPFAGGGVGEHYVFPDEGGYEDHNKKNLGTALNAQAGVILFRTGSLNLVMRGQYHLIFNHDRDNGPSFDMALRSKIGGESDNTFSDNGITTWIGIGLGAAFLAAFVLGISGN